MQIHLSEVLSQPGQTKDYSGPLAITHFVYGGASCPLRAVEPVRVRIYHKGNKKLEITLQVHVTLQVPCDRCLRDVSVPLAFISELKADMNQTDEERIRDLEEAAFIEGYTLDVDKLVEGELFLHMPMKVLCRNDCEGIRDGQETASESGGRGETGLDPRMAAIRDIFRKANQEEDKEV